MRVILLAFLFSSVLGCAAGPGPSADSMPPAETRVMSFNIRYPNPRDGDNYWPKRKQLVVDTIKNFEPDVLGVQEAYREQSDFILKRLEGYEFIGVGREDGKDKGEMTAVYYKVDRFELLRHGHFWLSDTPETVGSVGWDASLTRMATWLVLDDKHTDRKLLVINTHLDHRGQEARVESAKLIRRRLTRLMNAYPDAAAVVMGDFNADARTGQGVYDSLMGDGGKPVLTDTFAALHPDGKEQAGTFNGFRGRNDGARIDWIAVTDDLQIIDASIDRTNDNGRYPSDHYPVTAVVR